MQRRVVAGLGQRKPYGTFSGGIYRHDQIFYLNEKKIFYLNDFDKKIRMHTTAPCSRR